MFAILSALSTVLNIFQLFYHYIYCVGIFRSSTVFISIQGATYADAAFMLIDYEITNEFNQVKF